jgi:hypothetical protein
VLQPRRQQSSIPKKVVNIKVKGKRPRMRPRTRWNNGLGKMFHRGKEKHRKKLRRRYGKTQMERLGYHTIHVTWRGLKKKKKKRKTDCLICNAN